MIHQSTLIAAFAIAAIAGMNPMAEAEVVEAATWNGGGTDKNWNTAIGWQFTAKNDLTVTHLGVLDLEEAGLQDRHTVGIFNSAGDLMISTTISNGLVGDVFADSVIYNAVDLTTLQKDETYYILADNWSEDSYNYGWDSVNFSDDIEWLNYSQTSEGSIFSTVQHLEGQPGNLGPTFMYTTVPAPGALALLGLAAVAAHRRRTC